MPHGNLLIYKKTCQFEHPLILVIGREPNTGLEIVNSVTHYDFDLASRCGFWNSSYSLVAKKTGFQSTRCLKIACRDRESSPIIYADALPIGIPNDCQNKAERRRAICRDDIYRHVDNIFSHRGIIDRVSLIFLSGLYALEFEGAVSRIKNYIQHIRVPAIELKFFTSRNASAHMKAVSEENRELLKHVREVWLNEPRS